MELQTIKQVTQNYGISRRMLCYYEEIGLLESKRVDDYAYRVYDEAAIKKLQQIIILRKLQIPMKQIREILNNQDAVTIVEVFKQNINELDEQITALSTVKSILLRFVEELQEKADVRLKLDLLNDTVMLAVVNALSFPNNIIKEKVSMEKLNKASETLSKIDENNVRIVYRPPATVASIRHSSVDSAFEAKVRRDSETVAEKLIRDYDLFKLKPNMRVFGFGGGNGDISWEIWIDVPDDFDVPAPFVKKKYSGGMYAVTKNPKFDIYEWVENSDIYEWCGHSPNGEEYINPFNIYGMKTINAESMYIEHSVPIKEIKGLSVTSFKTELVKLERTISQGKIYDIDLTTMVNNLVKGNAEVTGNVNINYVNGFMSMKPDDYYKGGAMSTVELFSLPLLIELRAKTDKTDINIRYGNIVDVSFHHHQLRNKLCIMDLMNDNFQTYKKHELVVPNEYIAIELILSDKFLIIKKNNEIIHFDNDYEYIRRLKENPNFNLPSEVSIITCGGSTLTVESLQVTEL